MENFKAKLHISGFAFYIKNPFQSRNKSKVKNHNHIPVGFNKKISTVFGNKSKYWRRKSYLCASLPTISFRIHFIRKYEQVT